MNIIFLFFKKKELGKTRTGDPGVLGGIRPDEVVTVVWHPAAIIFVRLVHHTLTQK